MNLRFQALLCCESGLPPNGWANVWLIESSTRAKQGIPGREGPSAGFCKPRFTKTESARTPEEVERIREILLEGKGINRLRQVLAEFPHATERDIKFVIETFNEESEMDRLSAVADADAAEGMVKLVEGACRLSGNPDMDTLEAIAFLSQREEAGDQEARELLQALENPFLGDE